MQNSRLQSDSFPGAINETRTATSTAGGLALTTVAQVVGFPGGTSHAGIIVRNFATAVVVKWLLNPYLLILNSANNLGSATDFSSPAQKNPITTGVVLNAQPTLANGAALYVGSHVPFRGVAVVMSGSVNAVASVLTIEYWNGTAWTAVVGGSDGTASGGATFAQNGNITFTVPTDWAKIQLTQTASVPPGNPPNTPVTVNNLLPYNNKQNYWLRLSVSAALSAAVTVNSMFSLNRSTAYAQMIENSLVQFRTTDRPGGTACVEMLTDAGTANAIVNVYTDNPLGVLQ